MWANTQPHGGIVLIGIDDDGRVSDCKNTEQDHLNDLEAVNRLCPDARLEFKRVAVTNHNSEDDFVMVLRVYYRDDKLVETTGGASFVREGDEKRRLTEAEKREIRLNRGEIEFESEHVQLKFPEDFDLSLLNDFRNSYLAKRQLQTRFSIDDVLVLSKLGKVVSGTFHPNIACALLFAKTPDQ